MFNTINYSGAGFWKMLWVKLVGEYIINCDSGCRVAGYRHKGNLYITSIKQLPPIPDDGAVRITKGIAKYKNNFAKPCNELNVLNEGGADNG